jgi:hypothetical protein
VVHNSRVMQLALLGFHQPRNTNCMQGKCGPPSAPSDGTEIDQKALFSRSREHLRGDVRGKREVPTQSSEMAVPHDEVIYPDRRAILISAQRPWLYILRQER